jgi:hypothetical protein
MTRKSKKELTKQIMTEVMDKYDYSQALDIPIEELIGVEDQAPSAGIRSLPEMGSYIENFHSDNLFHFDALKKPYPEIVDPELQFIDQLIDDQVINNLIAPDSYSAVHRDIQPYQLFRMELLKIIKYPEISYRKFCLVQFRSKVRKYEFIPIQTAIVESAGTKGINRITLLATGFTL